MACCKVYLMPAPRRSKQATARMHLHDGDGRPEICQQDGSLHVPTTKIRSPRENSFAWYNIKVFERLPAFLAVKARHCCGLEPCAAPDKCALHRQMSHLKSRDLECNEMQQKVNVRWKPKIAITCSKLSSMVYTQHAFQLRFNLGI